MDLGTEPANNRVTSYSSLRFKKAKPRAHPYQDSYQVEPVRELDPKHDTLRLNLTASESSQSYQSLLDNKFSTNPDFRQTKNHSDDSS